MNTKEKIALGILIVCIVGWYFKMSDDLRKRSEARKKQLAEQVQNQKQAPAKDPDAASAPEIKPDTDTANPKEPVKVASKEPVKVAPKEAEPAPKTDDKPAVFPEFANVKPSEPIVLKVKEAVDGVASPLVDYVIDPQKGGIISVVLHKHKRVQKFEDPMTLGSDKYPVLSFVAGNNLKFSNAKIVEKTEFSLTISRQIIGTGVVVKQTWTAFPGSYRLRHQLTLENRAKERTQITNPRLLTGVMAPEAPAKGIFGASGMDQVARFYPITDDKSDYETIRKITKFDDDKKKYYREQQYNWVSVENKFFVTVCRGVQPVTEGDEKAKGKSVPMQGATFVTSVIESDDPPKKKPQRELIAYVHLPDMARIAPGGILVKDYEMYLGPKIYGKLKEMGGQEEEIMGFGRLIYPTFSFMRWIALGIYKLVVWLGGVFNNFGVAIIVATVIIRFILMPITYRSSVWSQRMKEVQPKMQEIKEKYGHDQQKVGQMTMALYKEHKINPLGGCLPIFVQLPVFFALFNVLRSAIELRHAGFIWWIQDLSHPDALCLLPKGLPLIGGMPLNILPFLMAGGTYLQQKTMPTSADPMQQKMMAFMTVFILFVCYNMPSGLTLYWTVGTVCSIAQFKVTQMLLAKQGNATEEKGKNEKTK